MNYRVYCGVDFHARQQTISCLTTGDGVVSTHELKHQNKAELKAFYAQLAGPVHMTVIVLVRANVVAAPAWADGWRCRYQGGRVHTLRHDRFQSIVGVGLGLGSVLATPAGAAFVAGDIKFDSRT